MAKIWAFCNVCYKVVHSNIRHKHQIHGVYETGYSKDQLFWLISCICSYPRLLWACQLDLPIWSSPFFFNMWFFEVCVSRFSLNDFFLVDKALLLELCTILWISDQNKKVIQNIECVILPQNTAPSRNLDKHAIL